MDRVKKVGDIEIEKKKRKTEKVYGHTQRQGERVREGERERDRTER